MDCGGQAVRTGDPTLQSTRRPRSLRPDSEVRTGVRTGRAVPARLTQVAHGAMRVVAWLRGSRWAHLGSNQGPLACEASALPLSYAPGRCKASEARATPQRPGGSPLFRRYEDAGCGDASPSRAGTDWSRKAGSGGRWPGSFRGIRCRTRSASSGSTRASSGLIRGTSGGSIVSIGAIEGSIGRDRLRLQRDVPCTSESVTYGTVRRACTTAARDWPLARSGQTYQR